MDTLDSVADNALFDFSLEFLFIFRREGVVQVKEHLIKDNPK